jgi:SAM-dependent methyltransferase
VSCPVCGAAAPRPKLRVGAVEILECGACGLAWWSPDPGDAAASLYDAGYFGDAASERGYDDYGGLERSLRQTFARRLRRLRLPAPGARLLDVGAAYGFAVAEARRAGWRAWGLEVSTAAARQAARAGLPVLVGSAERAPFAAGSFAAVTLWDVLEHLPNPHAAVAELARLLHPGGRLALTTGDVGSLVARLSGSRWHLYSLPEHLYFFSRTSLRRLLAAHGLRIEWMRAEGARYTLGYLAERLRKTLLGLSPARPVRFPGADWSLPINLFDIVTVHAVREENLVG